MRLRQPLTIIAIMPRKKLEDFSAGGAKLEQLNELHSLLVGVAKAQLEREEAMGEVKASTISAILKICEQGGVQPTREQASAMAQLYAVLPKVDVAATAALNRYSY